MPVSGLFLGRCIESKHDALKPLSDEVKGVVGDKFFFCRMRNVRPTDRDLCSMN
jgi:hypothetical protein